MIHVRRAALLLAASLAAACGGEPGKNPIPAAPNPTGGEGGSGGEIEQPGAGGGQGGAVPVSILPPLEIVDEADTDCAPIGDAMVEILNPSQATAPFDRLVRVGNKRAGGGVPGGAFTFDPDGGSQSEVLSPGDFNVMASEGDRIGILAVKDGQIVYRRFDAKGNKDGPKVELSSDPPANLALGAADGDALAVWGVPGRMRARGLVHGDIAGEAFDFGVGTIDNYFTASIAATEDRFAIAWNGNDTPTEFRTMFVTTTLDGDLSAERELVRATMAHRVVKLARTASGFALLLNADTVPPTPVVVILDDKGTVTGVAHRFLGVTFGWDLAVLGDELGLIARRAAGEIAFRALDAEGAPLAPWRCVTAPSQDLYQSAGIDADEDGYALLYRTPEGAEGLSIVDRLGSALPM